MAAGVGGQVLVDVAPPGKLFQQTVVIPDGSAVLTIGFRRFGRMYDGEKVIPCRLPVAFDDALEWSLQPDVNPPPCLVTVVSEVTVPDLALFEESHIHKRHPVCQQAEQKQVPGKRVGCSGCEWKGLETSEAGQADAAFGGPLHARVDLVERMLPFGQPLFRRLVVE